MKIFVIGCGRWGSFIAWYLDRSGHSVSLYGRDGSENFKRLRETGKNEYLTLPSGVLLTTDLRGAQKADTIVISVSSQSLSQVSNQLDEIGLKNKTIVLCMKGIEIITGRRLSEVAGDNLHPSNKIAVWLGPGHVQDFVAGIPNCMVIDSLDEDTKTRLVDAFGGGLIRFYYGNDIIGNELGAAAKNVVGIAAGILDGYSLPSMKGALMSRGTREVARLIAAAGGSELSAYGLCHLGDYEATVFSAYSNNRRFGEAIAKGETYSKLAEGYYTARALMLLADRYGVDLPICAATYRIMYEGSDPMREFDSLYARSLKREF